MALTRIKENQITDLAVTNAKIANATIAGGKLATNLSYGSDLTVTGNLTVSGTTTSVATTNTRIDDAILVLANGTSGSPSEDSGFIIDRGDSNNMALLWDETADVFILVDVGAEDGDTVGNVTVSGTRQTLQMGPLVATTGTFSGVVAATGFTIGSAVITEAELETIDGITAGTAAASKAVVLDGSKNIATIGTIGCGAITSSGVVAATGFTIGSAVINEAELETIDGVTVGTAIASKVVTADSNIDTTGQRNLTISGELDAATLDISGNADIDGTLEADAYTVDGTALNEYIADTIGAMVTSNTETGITVTYEDGDNTLDFVIGTLNQDTSGTATIATTVTITDNESTDESNAIIFTAGGAQGGGNLGLESDGTLTYNPSTGKVTATGFIGTLTGNVTGDTSGSSGSTTGNAATATALASARTIGGVSFDGTANIDLPGVNTTGSQNTSGTAAKVTVTDSTANTNFPVTFHDESNALLDDTGALRYNPSTGTLLVPNLTVAGTTTQVNTVTMNAANAIIFEGATADSHETTLSIVDPTADRTQYLINLGGYIPVLAAVTTTAISSTPAELNLLDGSSANSVVSSKAVIYGSSGELAGTLSTAAQTNITSLGTLTALTVDDVAINGKVVTMTGSSSDTAVMTVATNGAFSLVTTDDAAAAANIQITADGTAELAGTTVTLDSSGGITLDADNGTITFADAGSSLGTITSSGYTGNVVGNVTGNTSGTAATVTTAAQPNITSLGTLTTLTVDNVIINGATIGHTSDTDLMTVADGVLTIAGVVAATGFTIGSAVIAEAELETIDGITAGTAAASKAVVLDGSKNIATIGTIGCGAITSSGVVAATGFTIGSAVINEAELETIDGVTAGTVAASKAVVVDSSLDIASFRNVSMTGNLNVTDAGAVRVGTGNDFQVSHNGTDTTIANTTGIMAFNNTAGSAFRFNENSADVDFIVETNGNAAAFHIDGGNNNVGVGGAPNANAAFHVNSTGAILLAVGTTAQRPTAVTGMFRYNSTTGGIEYYDSDSWESVSSSFTIALSQTFNGDGSATAFTLSSLSGSDSYSTAGVLVMLNGIVQEPTEVYAVSSVTLTFTTAPATGDKIEVRKFTTTTTVINLSDSDGDTLVQTEESSDEDIIRFDAGGTEVARMSSTGIDITDSNKELRFYEGANYVGFEAPALSGNQIWVLPTADASTSGYALTSNASGTLSWAAAGATISQDNSTNTAFNLYYAATTSGALTAIKYDGSDMTFNPSTSTLACTTFSGALSGNATTATEATNITAVANNSTDETVYPTFVDGATGTQGLETDTGFTYNPSSGTLTSTIFAGTANAAKYADLAERYASDEEIEPGTVVQFVGEGKVAMCMNDSSRAVAGIVSTDPAYLMNSDQEGISLAIAGRVPCKVIGTVKTGDLMVCAGEGYARAEENPALGTVIGKAIESHSGTTGVIEVLTMMM